MLMKSGDGQTIFLDGFWKSIIFAQTAWVEVGIANELFTQPACTRYNLLEGSYREKFHYVGHIINTLKTFLMMKENYRISPVNLR